MLLIDSRVGSIELAKPLQIMGLPVRTTRLDCADVSFRGQGKNRPLRIGVERKKVSEIVQSIRSDKRFVKRQLPRMIRHYDIRVLIVEGYTTANRDGSLQLGKFDTDLHGQYHLYASYHKFLMTVRFKGSFHIAHTHSFTETIHYLHALYRWWRSPWTSHKSVYEVDETAPDTAILDERTWTRQVLAQFPGVGWARSSQVAKYFRTLDAAVQATPEIWREALGFKAGSKTAARIVQYVRGEMVGDGKGR